VSVLGLAIVHAVSDAGDRLVSADEPLASLQLRCGGELPGMIAVPALLELVRKVRRYRLKLARTFAAQDGTHAVSAWVEAQPRADGAEGCEIVLRNWRSVPLAQADPLQVGRIQDDIDRQLAELGARLDAGQRVLTVDADAPDLFELGEAMAAGIGRPWTDFVTIEGHSHRQPMHWRLLNGVTLSIAGSARTWRATLLPQMAGGGEPAGFELLLTAREPLPRATNALLPRAAPVGQFGAIGREIAPVLRQPIARIIANAETIRTRLAGPLAKEYADYAADIATAGQHLLGLVEDLADMEVVEADDFSTTPDRIDLAEVARKAAGILSVRASDKWIAVECPPEGERIPAIAEFRRVLQILLNLVGNAIRYSPEGSRIRIGMESDASYVRAVVADEGPGLAPGDQQRVFEKFERLGRSGDGGSGLGLYISRRLARAMGGDLGVESQPGEGARFILELPADPDGEDDDVPGDFGGDIPTFRRKLRLARIPLRRPDEEASAPPGQPDKDQADRG
jgi:signal transduction histidine kinase